MQQTASEVRAQNGKVDAMRGNRNSVPAPEMPTHHFPLSFKLTGAGDETTAGVQVRLEAVAFDDCLRPSKYV